MVLATAICAVPPVFATPTAGPAVANTQTVAAFDLENVVGRARELAARSFQDQGSQIPDWLLKISYDQWRDIRYRPERALWRAQGLPFEVQFFHPGFLYNRIVTINTVDPTGIHPVPFSRALFDYGHNDFAERVPEGLGFAGFRLHYPINRPDYKDELIVFLGASYFRAVAKGLGFGLSARGLAIDTALPGGEEFPYFREYWLSRPAPDAKEVTLYALLDSPRATGAYRFIVRPGEQTVVDIEARVFLREKVGKLGLTPLASMFYFGENSAQTVEDYRPEVHDSDGLLISTRGGEWIWRPLRNPRRLQVNAFQVANPNGFGLLQRDNNFDHYQDLETLRSKRPSLWIEPQYGFESGHIELVEIPTHSDTNDNIVTSWVPGQLPEPNQPMAFGYRMYWYGKDESRPPGGYTVATRHGRGTLEGTDRFVIDFEGGRLAKLPADTVVRGVVTLAGEPDQAEILEQQVVKNVVTGGWRLIFQVRPKRDQPLEMRAFLQLGDEALTETWSYAIEP